MKRKKKASSRRKPKLRQLTRPAWPSADAPETDRALEAAVQAVLKACENTARVGTTYSSGGIAEFGKRYQRAIETCVGKLIVHSKLYTSL